MTTTVLNTKIKEVDNKIPELRGSVKKTSYDSKISDMEKKCLTNSDYNKIMSDILDVKIKEKKWLINLIFLIS